MTAPPSNPNERILLFAAKPRDARLACHFLQQSGFDVVQHGSMESLLKALAAESAGALVITEEGVSDGEFDALQKILQAQPAWSDLPVILFALSGRSAIARRLAELGGNVTTLERPVMSATMLTALRSALRSRRKQYEVRDLLEGLQRATARLQEQDRRKDEFLAMLGHELRNPLSAVHNALHLIRHNPAPETLNRAHDVIERQSQHLARLVNDLLDVSRVTLGRIQLVLEPVDLEELAARCVQNFQGAARNQRCTLRHEGTGGMLIVNGDVVRLEQVLANLVTNALKYTPAGGEITLVSAREEPWATVRVIDSGIGIDPDTLPHVFELFTQGAQPLDRNRGGLGIGLSLAKSLLERHGGGIEAVSQGTGRGSEFLVRLPLATEVFDAPSAHGAGGDHDLHDLRHRVLVIEDNDDARETLEMMLELWGCQVAGARDGVEGLERLLEMRPDVAIVDIGLPRLDGYELARRARAAGLGPEVRLIALTGYGQPDDGRRAMEAGFDVHLTKPVRAGDLAPWFGPNASAAEARRGSRAAVS